jgi:HK97 family phage major capsid protein
MPEELQALITNLGTAFDVFKSENDTRLKEIEAKGHSDPLLTEKVEKIAKDITNLEAMRQQLDSVEDAVAKMQLPGGNGNGKEKVYSGPDAIGKQLLDVVTMATPNPGGAAYAAAKERLGKVQAAASGANETIPSDGGFLVGTDEANMLDKGAIATGLLSKDCFNVTATSDSDSLKLNLIDESSRANGSRFGGIQVYMKAEADTVTATKPKFREAVWNLNDCMGLMYATNDLLRDAGKLTAVVNKWFPMEFGFKIDDLIVNGTGAGMPLGITAAGCKVEQAVESGQVRATEPILYENIAHMYARLLSSSDANAKWYVNRALLPYLMLMNIPVGTGGVPVFLPPNGAAGQPYMTLMGKPIIPIEQCQAPATAGDIILADLDEYLLFTKGGIEASSSIHVRFIYDEMTFKWVYRLDGAPIRNKTLTPYKGGSTATQGPFVTLAS